MSPVRTCPACGRSLPADAPRGICPQCLLGAGLTPQPEATRDGSSVATEKSEIRNPKFQSHLRRFGDYELLEEIAQGGMGVVYRARQVSLDRTVAIKMLLFGRFTNTRFVERFRAEARAAARLRHPHIVAIHEVGEVDGQPYFSMDYVAGKNLADLVRDQPLPALRAATYLKTIAQAVHYAHQNGILHRDLKPSNILIDPEDQPRVTDFGLAKQLTGDSDLTLSGQMLGSPNYMPPEQAAGQRHQASATGDVYSLGAIFYHLLTGRPPFLAESLQGTLLQVTQHEPPSPGLLQPSVPKDLETICLKCLEKEPARRYQTAEELANELERFLGGEPIQARPINAANKLWRWCRRKPALASFAAATALLLLGILIGAPIAIYRINRERQRAESESLKARQLAYASEMNLAHQAINNGDLYRALPLLERHRPASRFGKSEMDLRGWEWRYLWKQCQGEQLFILGKRTTGVASSGVATETWPAAGFLPDGKTAYSAGNDNAVRLWDLVSRQQVGLLPHADCVTAAARSPDGRWMATATYSKSGEDPLLLWDLAAQKVAALLTTNFWVRPSMVFSPDSQLLAFVNLYTGIRLWSVAMRQEITNLHAYFRSLGPLGLAFSGDGETLAYCENEGGDIVLWNVRTRSPFKKLKGHTRQVLSLAFTPNDRLLVSASQDRSVKIWDVGQGSERATFTNYPVNVQSVRLSPDGKTLAVIGAQQVLLQDTTTGTIISQLRGHQHFVTDGGFAPDGRTFITGSNDGTVRVWETAAHAKQVDLRTYPVRLGELAGGSGNAIFLSPDASHLMPVLEDKTFSLWEVPSLSEGPRHPLPLTNFSCGALAPGGKLAAFVGSDGNIVLCHTDTGETNWFGRPFTNDSNRAVFSYDGKRLAIANMDEEVCVMDVESKSKLRAYRAPSSFIAMTLAFSPDGQWLMAGFEDGMVRVWDLSGRRKELTLKADDDQVRGLAVLPDGKTLVTARRAVRFWDLTSGRQTGEFKPRATYFFGCSISPDGRRLAIGDRDGIVTIWDLASRQEVATLSGHQQRVDFVSFLSDGDTLVSVSLDHVKIWRAASFEEADRPPLQQ